MALIQLEDIYLRSTTVPGLRPASADIQAGELMAQLADNELYVGTGNGNYFVVGAGGGGGTPPDGDSIIVSGGTMSVNHLECGTFS